MLSLAKLHQEDNSKMSALITGFVDYIKKFTLLDHILPKGNSNSKNKTAEASKDTAAVEEKAAAEKTKAVDDKDSVDETKPGALFPSKIVLKNDDLSKSSAVPCSTHGGETLMKIENEDGTISWKMNPETRDGSSMMTFSNITSPFMTTSGFQTFSPMSNAHIITDSPSPFTGALPKKIDTLQSPAHSVDSDLPNPEFFDIATQPNGLRTEYHGDDEEDGEHSTGDSNGDSYGEASSCSKSKTKKTYTCEFCGAEFRIRGYLTRHVKKHAITKAYECPFYEEHSENKCHPSGGFSRRDTYKTHLKARHFKYPQGTRSQDRANTGGKCGICNKYYESNEEWVEKHIESGECEGLPEGYTARAKNSRRKNFEYPNPAQISPVSSHSNDSPSTSGESPAVIHQQLITQESIGLSDEIARSKQLSSALQFPQRYNDYDNNDEFSLDVEQSMSFRPMMSQEYYS